MKSLLLSMFVVIAACGYAGDLSSKYEKIYFKGGKIELDDATLTIEGAVATDGYVKFKLFIKNKTNEILIVKASSFVFIVDGKEYQPKEKPFAVAPGEYNSQTIDVKGASFRTEKIAIKFEGFFRFKAESNTAPNYKLFSDKNASFGNFKISEIKNDRDKDIAMAWFNVTYSGSKLAITNTQNAKLKFPSGLELANARTREKPVILEGGQSDEFKVVWNKIAVDKNDDPRKNVLEIVWNDSFTEGGIMPITPKEHILEWDEALTESKVKK